jgi:hypothetical protein
MEVVGEGESAGRKGSVIVDFDARRGHRRFQPGSIPFILFTMVRAAKVGLRR